MWSARRSAALPIDLEQVVVTLPPGQPSERCALDLEYITPTNELVQIPLNPQRGSAPARFAATIDTPLPREAEGNRVYFRIMVSSEAQCGGPTREVVASAGSLMEVPLVPAGRERRAIMHVMAVNGESLDRDIGLDQINRDDFGRMIDHMGAGHHATGGRTGRHRPRRKAAHSLAGLESRGRRGQASAATMRASISS